MNEIKRKGARSKKDIPQEILLQLNNGEIESANLVEWLAIDRKKLLENILKKHDRLLYLDPIIIYINNLEKQTINTVSEAIDEGLLKQITIYNDNDFLKIIANYSSDLVRSWGAFVIGKNNTLTINQMLNNIEAYAKDEHFNVREEAWVATRPTIAQNLNLSIEILSEWASSDNAYLRRFASEATRPRGVWCKHIDALKQNPELALTILEPLKSDSEKYVRDSVGNWLNDASKTQPDYVINLCLRWEKESPTIETKYIIKRALRTLNK